MKKLFMPYVILIGFIFCTACSAGGGSAAPDKNSLKTFSSGFVLEMDGFSAEGVLTRYDSETWNVYFTSPSQISGVELDFKDDDVKASYKGLAFSVPQAAMPSKALVFQLIEAVDDMEDMDDIKGSKNDGIIEIEGEVEGEPYVISFNDDGSLAGFRMDNMGGSITFHDFTDAVQTTVTTTTIPVLSVTTIETEQPQS